MASQNGKILSFEEEQQLLAPIDEYVGQIQEKIDALRVDGTDQVTALTNHIAIVKENANYTKDEKAKIIAADKISLIKAKAVEREHKSQIDSLIADAVNYLNAHYKKEYYSKVRASCKAQKEEENKRYNEELAELKRLHAADMIYARDDID